MTKRCIKFAVSLLVFLTDSIVAGLRFVTGQQPLSKTVVLFYHSIPASHRAMFARQMDILIRRAKPVAAGIDTASTTEPGLHAVITFDDGFENVRLNALPELIARNIPAAIFVVAGNLGKLPAWQSFGLTFDKTELIMDADQLLSLPPGLITIGSHTSTHPVLTELGPEDARRELVESRVYLQELLGKSIDLFSFPYGEHNAELIALCREAGYRRVFTIESELGLSQANGFVSGRFSVEPTDWPLEFFLKLVGAYRWLAPVCALKRRVFS